MAIDFLLKFIHIFGLMLGAASGIGQMIVVRQVRRTPTPELARLRPMFGRVGLTGIILLWLSGLGLWAHRYDMSHLGPLFDLKMLVALVLLIIILVVTVTLRRSLKAGTPPPAWLPKLGMSTPVLTILAVGLAVWIFG